MAIRYQREKKDFSVQPEENQIKIGGRYLRWGKSINCPTTEASPFSSGSYNEVYRMVECKEVPNQSSPDCTLINSVFRKSGFRGNSISPYEYFIIKQLNDINDNLFAPNLRITGVKDDCQFGTTMKKLEIDLSKLLYKKERNIELFNNVFPFFDLIFADICFVLLVLKENNLIHNDLHTANVMVYQDEKKRYRGQVIDYGLAKSSRNPDEDVNKTYLFYKAVLVLSGNDLYNKLFDRSNQTYYYDIGIYQEVYDTYQKYDIKMPEIKRLNFSLLDIENSDAINLIISKYLKLKTKDIMVLLTSLNIYSLLESALDSKEFNKLYENDERFLSFAKRRKLNPALVIEEMEKFRLLSIDESILLYYIRITKEFLVINEIDGSKIVRLLLTVNQSYFKNLIYLQDIPIDAFFYLRTTLDIAVFQEKNIYKPMILDGVSYVGLSKVKITQGIGVKVVLLLNSSINFINKMISAMNEDDVHRLVIIFSNEDHLINYSNHLIVTRFMLGRKPASTILNEIKNDLSELYRGLIKVKNISEKGRYQYYDSGSDESESINRYVGNESKSVSSIKKSDVRPKEIQVIKPPSVRDRGFLSKINEEINLDEISLEDLDFGSSNEKLLKPETN